MRSAWPLRSATREEKKKKGDDEIEGSDEGVFEMDGSMLPLTPAQTGPLHASAASHSRGHKRTGSIKASK